MGGEVKTVMEEITAKLKQSDIEVVDKIDPELIKRLILNLHNDKNDSNFDWKSNALKVGVDSLCEPICDLMKAFIVLGLVISGNVSDMEFKKVRKKFFRKILGPAHFI